MPKPDAEEYARKVLWHICGLRADVRHMQAKLAEYASMESGVPSKTILLKWQSDCQASQNEIYLDAVRDIGLPPEGHQA
ncbi:MAG: hypothetical protein P4N60_20215 [Verrucomicrobiae bacterium]|nr:hypothetical protein [Verrucomicrobiae bacterium]